MLYQFRREVFKKEIGVHVQNIVDNHKSFANLTISPGRVKDDDIRRWEISGVSTVSDEIYLRNFYINNKGN